MPSALFVTTVDITLEAFLLPFAEHLRERGWSVDALAAGATGNARIAEAFDQRFDATWARTPLSLSNAHAVRRVRELVDAADYDLVWVHTPVAALLTRFALRRRARPAVVYTAHGFHFLKGGNPVTNGIYRRMERAAARWTDVLVTINDEDYAAARSFDTIDADRVRLVRGIGVDTLRYAPGVVSPERAANVRYELGIPDDAVLFAMIAEFTANKRHSLALEALGEVHDHRVMLAFVGSGPTADVIRSQAARRGLAERVRFAGYRSDIDTILAASGAALLCSAREGLNRSGLEAMACGVPIIGTPTRGIADLVGDEEAGWIAASHTPRALAEAMDAAAANETERARRGAIARRCAEREFSLERVIAAYDEVFASALASRPGARS